MNDYRWRTGGCHCKAVRFEVALPGSIEVEDCNCSICAIVRNAHVIVPAGWFRLLSGEDSLTTYTFNTHVAKHTFCKVCGVKAFYTPRSNPDGIAVTWACLDNPHDFEKIEINAFDGINWERNAGTLAHKSKDAPSD